MQSQEGGAARADTLPPGRRAAHVLGLWTAAITLPFYDLMSSNPEFFVARRVGPRDILLLVALMGFLLPGLLIVVERLCDKLNPRLSRAFHLLLLTATLFLLVIPSLAFTSTKTRVRPSRATMSISPSFVR